MTKTCTKCKETKPLSEFSKNKKAVDGLRWDCKACVKISNKTYRQANPDKISAKNAEYRQANKKAAAEYQVEYRQVNRDSLSEYQAEYQVEYRQENPAKFNAHTAKRRAAKIQATPSWANDFFIQEIYEHSQLLSKMSGVKHNVDHTIPLQHPLVCGLHTDQNLQILTAYENQVKSNTFKV